MAYKGYISSLPHERLAAAFPRRLAILGSTGSIGVSALRVVEEHPDDF
jgi:1-deoxy-D-xylulose-5-phosphate reductoisomerase